MGPALLGQLPRTQSPPVAPAWFMPKKYHIVVNDRLEFSLAYHL